MTRKLNYYFIISLLLFLISLTQKTYCTNNACGDYWGGLLSLIMGVIGVFFGGAFFTWLANPFLIISWIMQKSNLKSSLIFSGIAFFICLSFLFFDKIMVNEAGHFGKITGYGLGYWLWTMSSFIMFFGNFIAYKKSLTIKTKN